jgi:flagellin
MEGAMSSQGAISGVAVVARAGSSPWEALAVRASLACACGATSRTIRAKIKEISGFDVLIENDCKPGLIPVKKREGKPIRRGGSGIFQARIRDNGCLSLDLKSQLIDTHGYSLRRSRGLRLRKTPFRPLFAEEGTMVISTDGMPQVARNSLNTRSEIVKTINEVSSGSKLSGASDSSGTFAIATEFAAELASTQAARRNTVGAISAIRVGLAGMESSTDALMRLGELAVSASSSTLDDTARGAIQTEVDSIVSFMDSVSETTQFNGVPLLNGNEGALSFQVGTGSSSDNQIILDTPDIGIEALGLTLPLVTTAEDAQNLLDAVDSAMNKLGEAKASVGGTESALTTAHDRASGEITSKQSALSNLRDTDMASASTGLATELVLAQAQVAMRAQSNASASVTLRLLG